MLIDVDFAIIGGGSAGCVLANRLTASGRHRVVLVEAGGEPRSPFIRLPAGFGQLLRRPTYNWGYESDPDPATANRHIPIPSGRGLGGSGLINGMVYVRGQPADYDDWAKAGAHGWSWADVEPYFRKLENYAGPGDRRGHNGPFHLTQVRERFPIADAFLTAAQQNGGELVEDYNIDQRGFGYYQVNQYRGRRWSPYDAYLKQARRRRNLSILTHTWATQLVFDGRRCTGVRLVRNGQEITVRAREVIVAAGAIRSPQLLEVSGIGSPEVLSRIGVPVIHSHPEVGEGYRDHYALRMNWRLSGVASLNENTRGVRLAAAAGRYLARRRGILTLGPALCHGFIDTGVFDERRPDAQLLFMHASYEDASRRELDREPGMTIGIIQQRPHSVGSIHAVSTAVGRPPSIQPRFLTDPADGRCVVAAMRSARRLVAQPALAPYVVREMNPGSRAVDDDDLLDWARQTGQTLYHPCGTCRMGDDERAVLDERLRVRGIDGLRVADASAFPTIVSGNIHGAVLMLAEKASDMILDDAS